MSFKDQKTDEKREESSKSELMQRFRAHPFLFIGTVLVLVIVIVAFVFVPAIVPSAQRGNELIFGYYNKIPIKYVPGNYFYQLTQRERLSQDDPQYITRMAEVWGEAFVETAVHLAILDEMKNAGYRAPESVVDREVAMLPVFQENGKFSSVRYRAMDNNSRMSLWRQTQENVTAGIYRTDLEKMKISSKEVPFIVSMNSPKRSFDLAVYPISSYPDSEVNSYVAANADLFRVTRLSKITVTSGEREARQIYESVKNGVSTFEETARTNSQDNYSDRGGDMGIQMAFEFMHDISDEQDRNRVIHLARGEMSDVVKVSSGWAFFRAEEASRPADINDQSQGAKIRNYIMSNERGRAENWLLAEAEKFIARSEQSSFDDAISDGNFSRRSFGPISVNFGNVLPFGSLAYSGVPELENAGANLFFWNLAFSTPINTLSRPLVVGDNVIILKPLEENNSDEDDSGYAEMFNSYWSYWLSNIMSSSARNKFMSSSKLDNRFNETFWSLWNF